MSRRLPSVDGRLPPWEEVAGAGVQWTGLLIGNGASRVVWEEFGYASLYERAMPGRVANPLSPEDRALFKRLETTNFEVVLSALRNAEIVCASLGMETARIRARYNSIKYALIEAVRAVHVPWSWVLDQTLIQIRDAMLGHEFVFSTNYDLLLYWALMSGDPDDFRDYFWSWRDFDGERWMVFDPDDTEADQFATKLLYLHGGLHLAEMPWGESAKMIADTGGSLLEKFLLPAEDDPHQIVPLFITEGDSRDKIDTIRRSDYLSFAFETFGSHGGPLVVFGHGLGSGDAHLVRAMNAWRDRPIAVSLLPGDESTTIRRKLEVLKSLQDAQVHSSMH